MGDQTSEIKTSQRTLAEPAPINYREILKFTTIDEASWGKIAVIWWEWHSDGVNINTLDNFGLEGKDTEWYSSDTEFIVDFLRQSIDGKKPGDALPHADIWPKCLLVITGGYARRFHPRARPSELGVILDTEFAKLRIQSLAVLERNERFDREKWNEDWPLGTDMSNLSSWMIELQAEIEMRKRAAREVEETV